MIRLLSLSHIVPFLSIFLLLLGFSGFSVSQPLPDPFKITPTPKEIKLHPSAGLPPALLSGLYATHFSDFDVLGSHLQKLPLLKQGGDQPHVSLTISTTGLPSDEGYILTVARSGVSITADTEVGLFYACQTLEQLIADALEAGVPIPYCTIKDYPDMTYRAVHFDMKHHLDHINRYYELIDRLASYKINGIIFEFEDKLAYRRQPLVGSSHAISIEEMAALTQYARRRYIDVSPLVQGLGHATFILKHETYAHLREHPDSYWAFCPADSGTYEVLNDLYLDAIEATPGSKYVHIGGDEIGNIGQCPRCRPLAEKEGTLGLNLHWLNKVSAFLKEKGRAPIFWDDMPLKEIDVFQMSLDKKMSSDEVDKLWNERIVGLDQIVERFPKNGIFMRWHYQDGALPGNIKIMEWYNQKKLNAMVAGATQFGDHVLFPPDNNQNTKNLYQHAVENGITGGVSTAWDDRSLHMDTYWRGFIASAEYAWSTDKRSVEELDQAFLHREFGIKMDGYAELYSALRAGATFWNYALLKKSGRTHRSNTLFPIRIDGYWADALKAAVDTNFLEKLIDLPAGNQPGKWSESQEVRIREASRLLAEKSAIQHQLDYLYEHSKKNRSHWEIFRHLYDFQLFVPELWVALNKWDLATDKQPHTEQIRRLMEDFSRRWNALQLVYGKTRHLSYPRDYVPDRYWQFASQREDLSWMIQVEERMLEKLNRWLKK